MQNSFLMMCDIQSFYHATIILPRKNWVTKLIVKHYHEMGNHNAGVNQTLSLLSSKYWIIAAREEIIEWEKQCVFYKKEKLRMLSKLWHYYL